MKTAGKFLLLALSVVALSNLVLDQVEASPLAAQSASSPNKSATSSNKSTGQTQKFRRFDFRLEGVSCARCIINIRTALRNTKGVSRCEVALRKPYGGVVIYNPALMDQQKLTKITLTADPKTTVTVKDTIDESIDRVPAVLIPKHTSLQKTQTDLPQN